MTEGEAKTKWCPAFRGSDHGTNRPHEIGGHGFCIGSACMAWREVVADREIRITADRPTGQGWSDTGRKSGRKHIWGRALLKGFCGLAGRPE